MNDAITPLTIAIDQAQLDDLRQRLQQTRWPDEEPTSDWQQGVPANYMREIADYWSNTYDWRRCETLLNQWEQRLTTIDGVDIHFLHARSPHDDALPLIITHGWPGSIIEFHKVIEPLRNPTAHGGRAEDAFHVVCPSLPGYGFSGKPAATGWGVEKIGRAWGTLMARLGYSRYVAQGGDWGSMVTHSIARTEQKHCAAVHVNMPLVTPDPDTMDNLSDTEQAALQGMTDYFDHGSGYSKQQSTRPQTLGYGLADSPIGQAAWILEKFYAWTDCGKDGAAHPENVLNKDELLDNVMLYWLNNAGASSARLYWESFDNPDLEPLDTPVGCSIFPKEIMRASRRWAEKRYTQLIHWNELDKGGHFAAFEQPDLFIREVRDCFRQIR